MLATFFLALQVLVIWEAFARDFAFTGGIETMFFSLFFFSKWFFAGSSSKYNHATVEFKLHLVDVYHHLFRYKGFYFQTLAHVFLPL